MKLLGKFEFFLRELNGFLEFFDFVFGGEVSIREVDFLFFQR
jgi:hypothetical protein